MLTTGLPPRRTYDHRPDKQELAAPLDQPGVHTARLRYTRDGDRVVARWVIPWGWVVFSFVSALGSMTAGVLIGHSMDRMGGVTASIFLAVVWLIFLPMAVWLVHRALHRALTRPEHIVLDVGARQMVVALADGKEETIPFDQIEALVSVTRMIRVSTNPGNDSGRRWSRRSEFSVLHALGDGEWVQVPLYAIQDEGKREEELRRWTNELPRMLGCERVVVSLDRDGEVRGRQHVGAE